MSIFSQVAWKEGMFMVPQHFQQAERAQEHALSLRFKGLGPHAWGVASLRFQEGAIRQGRIALESCTAILHDGTGVDIPHADPCPPPRQISLGPDNKPVDVYLVLPAIQPRIPTLTRERSRSDIRYLEHELRIPDDTQPEREQPVKLAIKNLQLVLGHEPMEGKVRLRLGRVVPSPDGSPMFAPQLPPPLLVTTASEWLLQELRALVGKADARVQALRMERTRATGEAVEFSQGDILSFWFLHALNVGLLPLKQLIQQHELHPFGIFLELLRLSGALSSFDATLLPSLKWYDHEDPGPAFDALFRVLRRQLEYNMTLKHELITLTREEHWWQGTLQDPELRATGKFILAFIGETPSQALVEKLVSAVKIADPDELDRLIARALQGVPLRYLPRVPATVPSRTDACYLELAQDSPLFKRIQQTGAIAVFIPSYLGKLKVELIGIRGGGR